MVQSAAFYGCNLLPTCDQKSMQQTDLALINGITDFGFRHPSAHCHGVQPVSPSFFPNRALRDNLPDALTYLNVDKAPVGKYEAAGDCFLA